jgi:Protein of unknown function (DUF4058)
MSLRDHFRSPVNDRHRWDALHGGWPMKIVEHLGPKLPKQFVAGPQIHLGGSVEIDVGAYERDDSNGSAWQNGGTATALAVEPTLRVETEIPDLDEYEVRVYDVSRANRLVAAIELVSPANKDRPDTRRAFVTKCAALLQQQVSVTIVDLVTIHGFNLYDELLALFRQNDPTLAKPPSNIYAAACRGTIPRKRWTLETWYRPLTVGQPLPSLPLWLTDDLQIPLDLEPSYEDACRVLRIE